MLSFIGHATKDFEQAHSSHDKEEWFALQVTPRHEFSTAKILRHKGFEEFVPTYITRRQWSDRVKITTLPLFTGYVFSKFCSSAKLPIITTPGVVRIVGSRKGPIPVAPEQLEMVRKASQSPKSVQPHPYAPVGTRVRITDGPLAGIEGTLQGFGRSELIVSVDIVQRSMCISIEGCSLALLDHAQPEYSMTA